MADTVTLSKADYDAMQERLDFLSCLEAAGVDNWCGYSEAWKMLEEGDAYEG